MGKHLNMGLWYDKMSTGKLRMKRVSAEAEAHFPRELRVILRDRGPLALVQHLMALKGGTMLGDAWDDTKRMVNEKPGVMR